MMRKHIWASLLASLGLLIFASVAWAQSAVGISFGIRPTKAYEDRPETFSYFHHILDPGVVFEDEALVMNDGDTPIVLKMYSADAITAQNGGTTFTKQGQQTSGVSAWLTPSVLEIHLGPGDAWSIPFTISVPADAAPGHHIAGLVVEALPGGGGPVSGAGGEAQFLVSVVRRVGVAVVIEVPGSTETALEISDAYLSEQSEAGATFGLEIHNSGSVFMQSQGVLKLFAMDGEELARIPLTLDTVLPGDTATFWVTHPIHLTDSDYLLDAEISYEGGTALLERVQVFVRDDQPVLEAQSGEDLLPPAITEIMPASARSLGSGLLVLLALGLGLVLLLLSAIFFLIRRRPR